jgi:hypothetical protein
MIKRTATLEAFERKMLVSEKIDIDERLRLMDSLYREAVAFGAFPLKDPLEGLDVDIKYARVINSVPKPPAKNRRRIR